MSNGGGSKGDNVPLQASLAGLISLNARVDTGIASETVLPEAAVLLSVNSSGSAAIAAGFAEFREVARLKLT